MSAISGQPYSGTISRSIVPSAKIGLLQFLLLISLALAVTFWGAGFITGARGYELGEFISLAGLFGVACAFFVTSRLSEGLYNLFEIPVYMTILAFVMFALAPLGNFFQPETLAPELHGDTSLFYPALLIVFAGMAAFWFGTSMARSRRRAPANLDVRSLPGSEPRALTLVFGVGLYFISIMVKVYMLHSGMYGYTQSQDVYNARMAEQQFWIVIERFGFYALVLFATEAYFHPRDRFRKSLFWAALGSECFWAFISGMKRPVLESLLIIAVISSFANRKLRLRWFVLAVGGLVAIYPLMSNYRAIIHRTENDSIRDVSGATEAVRGAAGRSALRTSTVGAYLETGWTASVARLNMTSYVALLIANKERAYLLEGDERLWMIPIYPFIPRFIWTSKPIENYGGRFTRLLGGSATVASSPTIPGDLYIRFGGIPGVMLGMFLIGLAAQWLTNPVKLSPTKRNLFIYGCIFFMLANWEDDFFATCTALIRALVIILIVAAMVYGPVRMPRPSRAMAEAGKLKLEDGGKGLGASA